jgi:predicted type IV restriction endonuclease
VDAAQSKAAFFILPIRKSFMPAPAQVQQLVERFDYNLTDYKQGKYNEAQVRREFIDPLFKALGWDIDNEHGYAEAYKEVVHEDAIKIGRATKAPDYSFRIGGVRKFFLEAKKPSVNIKDDTHPAYQLRRYAWSAKLPLSILTDFEEFAVYDCRVQPAKTDKAAAARIMYFHYTDYPDRWPDLLNIFSPDAIRKGAFDKYVESNKAKKGTAEVDNAFLQEIERWRDLLARNLALRNTLTQRQLNFAVQTIIDRLIFLRIAEDRGIEPYGQLQTLQKSTGIYPQLLQLFQRADDRYNSGLFYFKAEKGRADEPDILTPTLALDDKVLQDIFKHTYYPDSPYEFSVLPADILGQVYEQFLGKVIRLTAGGHRAIVEDKPEVKKAGGVFYTPTYIVDYIVRQTVGRLVQGKTPHQLRGSSPLRIVDPACGSGSFLLGAYQYLLNWHRDWYSANDAPQWAKGRNPRLYQTPAGDWKLTTAERKQILLTHIYGVDIDAQAVEVTKLSLLLKVLEGEDQQSLARQLSMFQERVLPDLGRNIKCGNSLIGPDFYHSNPTQLSMFDEDELYRINVFDWQAEFAPVFADGGFDAVIGNPPYIRIQAMKEWAPREVEFYKERYISASKGNYDIYVVFVEKGLALLNERGRLGFILPHKFFNAKYGEPLRGLLAEGKHLSDIVHFGDQQVFANATTYTCLLFLNKQAENSFHFVKAHDLTAWRQVEPQPGGNIAADKVTAGEWNFVVGSGADLFQRLDNFPVKLGSIAARMYQGPITSADSVFLFKDYERADNRNVVDVFSKELGGWVQIESTIMKDVVRSGNIHRYEAEPTAIVLFPYEVKNKTARLFPQSELQENYPLAWEYLNKNKKLLQNREKAKFTDSEWYRFGRTQNLGLWEQPKLMVPYMITRLSTFLDTKNYYFINVTTGGYGITVNEGYGSLAYYCGLLNSKLLDFYLKRVSTNFHGGYFAANKQFIEQLPIRTINFDDPTDKARHDSMVALVERMLALHEQLAQAQVPQTKTMLKRQIEAADRQIDRLVFELYGLTPAEINIVEGNA